MDSIVRGINKSGVARGEGRGATHVRGTWEASGLVPANAPRLARGFDRPLDPDASRRSALSSAGRWSRRQQSSHRHLLIPFTRASRSLRSLGPVSHPRASPGPCEPGPLCACASPRGCARGLAMSLKMEFGTYKGAGPRVRMRRRADLGRRLTRRLSLVAKVPAALLNRASLPEPRSLEITAIAPDKSQLTVSPLLVSRVSPPAVIPRQNPPKTNPPHSSGLRTTRSSSAPTWPNLPASTSALFDSLSLLKPPHQPPPPPLAESRELSRENVRLDISRCVTETDRSNSSQPVLFARVSSLGSCSTLSKFHPLSLSLSSPPLKIT
jgi:hypothetical protein